MEREQPAPDDLIDERGKTGERIAEKEEFDRGRRRINDPRRPGACLQNWKRAPNLTIRGAMISETRPKYAVLERLASNCSRLGKACVNVL